MKREEFLNMRNWPALLSVEETAWVIGTEYCYVAVLTAAGLLKPAGRPKQNGRKFYSRDYVIELAKDQAWLNRAAIAMVNFNAARNDRPAKQEHKELAAA
jgi:hypothetical protein